MNKLIFKLGFVALVIAMSSCAKEYTCECISVEDGNSTVVKTTLDDTKKGAKKDCDEAAELNTDDVTKTTCEIK